MNSTTGKLPRRAFKVSKKSDTYAFVPETTDPRQDYRMDVTARTNGHSPFMVLYDGSKNLIGSVKRETMSSPFEIKLSHDGKLDYETAPSILLDDLGNKQGAFDFTLATGKTRLHWNGADKDDEASYKLIEADAASGHPVLATFTQSKGFTSKKGGVLDLSVDWGSDFEQAVILSFVTLFDFKDSSNAIARAMWSGTSVAAG